MASMNWVMGYIPASQRHPFPRQPYGLLPPTPFRGRGRMANDITTCAWLHAADTCDRLQSHAVPTSHTSASPTCNPHPLPAHYLSVVRT